METKAVIPTWSDKNFIATILQDGDMLKPINVLSFSAKPEVAAGNNYYSVLLRIKIEYETKCGPPTETSLIVKTPLPDGPGKDRLAELGFIEKECSIYKDILLIMNKLLNKNIVPKKYVCDVPETIILEDLKEKGYAICDRLEQLDFEHCNNFMKVISTFHVLSLHIHKQYPELIEKAGRELIFRSVPNPKTKKHFCERLESFAKIIDEWEGVEHYPKFIRDNLDTLWSRAVSVCNVKKHRVLNHGDTWTNNMLFKHDETG